MPNMSFRSFHCAALAMIVAGPACAQNMVCTTGEPAVLRVSRIKPGGSMAQFEKAVADHSKWYADHGYGADRQIIAPVIVPGPQGPQISTDQVMTIHTHAHTVPQDRRDADWTAFVAEYRATSDVMSETTVCLPPMR